MLNWRFQPAITGQNRWGIWLYTVSVRFAAASQISSLQQLCQEHTVTQPTSFVPGHSSYLSADDSNCLSGASHNNSAQRGFLQGRYRPSAQSFPENAGPYGSGFTGTSVGSALHATHPVLAEAEGSIRGLASRTPPRNGDSGLCISPGPFKGPPLAKARRDLTHSAQKEGCSNKGWGALCEGQTDLRSWSEEESGLHINCLEILAVCHACQFFLLDIWGHHVLVRSDSRSVLS